MSRGNRRQDIYLEDVDRQDFLKTLAEACQKTAWQIHAYCLMSNHYHPVVETITVPRSRERTSEGPGLRQSTAAFCTHRPGSPQITGQLQPPNTPWVNFSPRERREMRCANYLVKGLALLYAQAMSFSSLRRWVNGARASTAGPAANAPTPARIG